jgi:4-amino-4-deoxychorismate lyase
VVKKVSSTSLSSNLPRTLINGESCDSVVVSDRGLAYGHGVFETIRLSKGKLVLWDEHMARMLLGCKRLGIDVPKRLSAELIDDVRRLCMQDAEGVIKIIITAGSGGRGYAAPLLTGSQRVVTLFPLPVYPADRSEGVNVITCNYRLPCNTQLAGIKHLNRLDQVLARAEWQDANIAEGIVCDNKDNVVEGTMSNLFAVKGGVLLTPVLEQAGVKGIMRDFILQNADAMGLESREVSLTVEEFKQVDELFLTNSVIGLWPIKQWDDQRYSKGAITENFQARIDRLLNEGS